MYDLILYAWLIAAVAAFIALLKFPAPYGRHAGKDWGPTMSAPLGWFLMEFPSPVILTLFVVQGSLQKTPVIWLFVGLWWLHYANRSLLYPLRIRETKTRIPMLTVGLGVVFHVINGYVVGHFFGETGRTYDLGWMNQIEFVVGGSLFLAGMVINWKSDGILIRAKQEASGGYAVPRGGLFKYVSAPNYFGEIVEWVGFAIMTWCLPAAAFAIWTVANLAPRALSHHRWYKEKFPDYPEERKALVPFIV